MKSIKLYLPLLLMGMSLAAARPCSAQTMTNTAHTITLTGTCLSDSLTTGSYTLTLYYINPDTGPVHPSPVTVSVVVSGSTAVITVPSTLILPTPATDGWWSLSDADQGSIILSNPGGRIVGWQHDNFGNTVFFCNPLILTK